MVAGAAIGAGVASALGGSLAGLERRNALDNHLAHLGTSGAAMLANAATRSLLEGTDFGDNVLAALPDVLAQSLFGMVTRGVSEGGGADRKLTVAQAQELRYAMHSEETSARNAGQAPAAVQAAMDRDAVQPLSVLESKVFDGVAGRLSEFGIAGKRRSVPVASSPASSRSAHSTGQAPKAQVFVEQAPDATPPAAPRGAIVVRMPGEVRFNTEDGTRVAKTGSGTVKLDAFVAMVSQVDQGEGYWMFWARGQGTAAMYSDAVYAKDRRTLLHTNYYEAGTGRYLGTHNPGDRMFTLDDGQITASYFDPPPFAIRQGGMGNESLATLFRPSIETIAELPGAILAGIRKASEFNERNGLFSEVPLSTYMRMQAAGPGSGGWIDPQMWNMPQVIDPNTGREVTVRTGAGPLDALAFFPQVRLGKVFEWIPSVSRSGKVVGATFAAERGLASFGTSTTSNYAKTFFAANPELKGQVVVHHAVEQQVLTKFPGVVTKGEINSLENLRGIPNSLNPHLHLSEIRVEWNRFYKPFVANGTQPTKSQLLQKATEIDTRFGTKFNPPLGGGR
jgi:hypothetical protein